MKKLLSMALSFLLLAGCTPAVYEGPTETIWVLTESTTEHISPATGAGWTVRQTLAYDIYGNVVRTCSYQDGKLESESKIRYDERGNPISKVLWDHSGLISLPQSRTSHTYDSQNRLLTTTYRNGFGFQTGSDAYIYDDEANTVFWDGTYDTRTTWNDENGNPLRSLTHSEVGGGDMETIYTYDDLGRNTGITSYFDGALLSRTECRYDDRDRLVEELLYDETDTLHNHTTYTYGENTLTTQRSNGNRIVESYRDGRIERMEHFNSDGELLIRTTYTHQQIRIPAKEE